MYKELNELFVFNRGGTIVNIDGNKFYGSDSLNERIANALASTSVTKPIANKIAELIYGRTLVPLFSNKNMIQFLYRKIFNPQEYDYISGFWSPEVNKIFLFVDTEINKFGYASNDMLGRIVLHEMMHMVAHLKASKFYSLFKDEMVKFYRAYLSIIFSIDEEKLTDKKIMNFIAFLKKHFEKSGRITLGSSLKKYAVTLNSFRKESTLKDNQYDKIVQNYIVTLSIYFRDGMTFKRSYNSPLWKSIYGPLFTVYKDVFAISTQLMLAQELVFPSEIISLIAESKPSAKVYTAIRML